MLRCNVCEIVDIEAVIITLRDEEVEQCPECESLNYIKYIDDKDWEDELIAIEADRFNDEIRD